MQTVSQFACKWLGESGVARIETRVFKRGG